MKTNGPKKPANLFKRLMLLSLLANFALFGCLISKRSIAFVLVGQSNPQQNSPLQLAETKDGYFHPGNLVYGHLQLDDRIGKSRTNCIALQSIPNYFDFTNIQFGLLQVLKSMDNLQLTMKEFVVTRVTRSMHSNTI